MIVAVPVYPFKTIFAIYRKRCPKFLKVGIILDYLFINSLLPLGRYINMDPYPTWLLISWT